MFANWVGPRRGRVNLLAYFADVPEFPQLLLLAEHARAPDGAHRRVVNPAHFAPLFGWKPRGQVMLYREALLGLGGVAQRYLSELSRRQRARLGTEVLAVYALYERCGAAALLAAMELAQAQGAFGPAYLGALVSAPVPEPPPEPASLELTDVPAQTEIDRELSAYEAYVWPIDVQHDLDHHELVLNGRHADELQPDFAALGPLLEQLFLRQAAAVLPDWLDRAASQELSYADFLHGLLEEESVARANAATQKRLRQAGFPYAATIEQFDFRFRPELKRQVVLRYLDPNFIEQARTLALIGPPGWARRCWRSASPPSTPTRPSSTPAAN